MSWYGPGDQCGCECDRLCKCSADPSVPSQAFIGKPTIRIVISGLPASYEWVDYVGQIFLWERNEWNLAGISGLNGTYFIELQKRNDFCIDETFSVSFDSVFGYVENRIRSLSPFADQCAVNFTETTNLTKNINVFGTSGGGSLSLRIEAGLTFYYGIRALISFSCLDGYDMSRAEGENSINAGIVEPSRTWPKASGEIKIIRRALMLDACGYPAESADGIIFKTIGSISAEILDL